jgi:selenocysteine lyase/cysteine desulfurase
MGVDRRGFLVSAGLSVAGSVLVPPAAPSHAGAAPLALGPEPDWNAVRDQFELSRDYVNLGTFYLSSHPRPVRDAIEKYRKLLDENPLYVEEVMFEDWSNNKPLHVKKVIAEYLGARAEEIALTPNTTTSLALLYNGLKIEPGQEILTTEHDHYSHHESIRLAVQKSGAGMKRVALHDGAATAREETMVERLRKAITPRTRAVGVTWVHSSTGLKLPIRRIAEAVTKANAGRADADRCLLIVDGVHGLGVEDEAVATLGCDFFAAGTHKWIFGPRGTGILWGRADAWLHTRPTVPTFEANGPFEAWRKDEPVSPATQAAWVSPGGFWAFEHQWGVEAAFRFHQQLGRTQIAERIHALNGQIKEGLAAMPHVVLHTPRGSTLSAGIVCFDVKGLKPEEVVARLRPKKILATTTPYAVSYARVAAGIMIQPEEIETTLREIRGLAAA